MQVAFSRFNGDQIGINGSQYTIPEAGVIGTVNNATINGITGQSLAPTTLYYAYAYMDGGVMKLDFSVTGWVTNPQTGLGIKYGDASRAIVGMGYTDGAGKFIGDDVSQLTSSFYNRVRIGLKKTVTGCSTGSTSWTEPNSNNRVSFVCWQDDIPDVDLAGVVSNNTLSARTFVAIGKDGVTGPCSSIAVMDCPAVGAAMPFSCKASSTAGWIEGRHAFTVIMKVSQGYAQLSPPYATTEEWTQISASPVPS